MKQEYTVLEAAQALNVTKNTVKGRLHRLPPDMMTRAEDGKILIAPEALPFLSEPPRSKPVYTGSKPPYEPPEPPQTTQTAEDNHQPTSLQTGSQTSAEPQQTTNEPPHEPAPDMVDREVVEAMEETIAALRGQLDQQAQQLKKKDEQIEGLTAAVLNAQAQTKAAMEQLAAAQALHAGTIQTAMIEPPPDKEKAPDTYHKTLWERFKGWF